MPQMKIDTEHMHQASSQINAGASNLLQQINNFKSIITHLTGSGWVAPSGKAFEEAHQQWNAAANQMHQAITKMSQAAGTAGNNFSQADTSSTVHR